MYRHPPTASARVGRRGFTILEVLVVMGVIFVALALLLPAMLDAQKTARRVQCQNNLKQIALALHNYHDMHSVFPPGYIVRDVEPGDPAMLERGPGYAWSALLLPFLDQTALSRTIDFSTDPISGPMGGGTGLSVYRCPTPIDAPMNYVACFGVGSLTQAPGRPDGPGIFFRNSKVPEFDIRDGSSTTILVGERVGIHDFVPGQPAVEAEARWLAAPAGINRDAGLDIAGAIEGPASYVLANVGQDTPFEVHEVHCRTNHVAAFSSAHPGGAQFAFGDGAVVFLSSDIDPVLYRRLGQRSDHEVAEIPRGD